MTKPIVYVVDFIPGMPLVWEKCLQDNFFILELGGTTEEVAWNIQFKRPDVVILGLKEQDNLAVLRKLVSDDSVSKSKILIFTLSQDLEHLAELLKLGAHGILLKTTVVEFFSVAVMKVLEGQIWLDPGISTGVIQTLLGMMTKQRSVASTPLTVREREILALVCVPMRNKQMAEELHISEQTVKNHLHAMFDKLGVSSRSDLMKYAIDRGWVSPKPVLAEAS